MKKSILRSIFTIFFINNLILLDINSAPRFSKNQKYKNSSDNEEAEVQIIGNLINHGKFSSTLSALSRALHCKGMHIDTNTTSNQLAKSIIYYLHQDKIDMNCPIKHLIVKESKIDKEYRTHQLLVKYWKMSKDIVKNTDNQGLIEITKTLENLTSKEHNEEEEKFDSYHDFITVENNTYDYSLNQINEMKNEEFSSMDISNLIDKILSTRDDRVKICQNAFAKTFNNFKLIDK